MTSDLEDSAHAVWQHDFTVDNLIDYARASRHLSAYVRVLVREGFQHLVVPSRGAVPFVEAAWTAWSLEARGLPTVDERVSATKELNASPLLVQLVLPFSADPQDATQTTASIRRYWSQVLAALVRRDGTDPRLTFYKALVEQLARRSWLSALPRDLPNDKFIFVDTVISGRAICEIFAAFAEVGLDQCHFILIVDAEGKEIAPQYRRVIDEMIHVQRCTLIPIRRLFTEDRGPAVSGVWSTVYPQVLDAVRNKFAWAAHAYGAGTFYHQVSSSQVETKQGVGTVDYYNMPVTRMFGSLSVGVYTAVSALQQMDNAVADLAKTVGSDMQGFEDIVGRQRTELEANLRRQLQYQLFAFRDTIAEMKPLTPLDKQTTRILAEPRVLVAHPNAVVDVSSSHLVRVTLPEAEIAAFMRAAEREIGAGHDVLADDWFR